MEFITSQINNIKYRAKHIESPFEMKLQVDDTTVSNNVSFILRLKLRKHHKPVYSQAELKEAMEHLVPELFKVYNPDIVLFGLNEINIVYFSKPTNDSNVGNYLHLFAGKKDKIKSIIPSFCSVVLNQYLSMNSKDLRVDKFGIKNASARDQVQTFECEELKEYIYTNYLVEYLTSRSNEIKHSYLRSLARLYYTYDTYSEATTDYLEDLLSNKNVNVEAYEGTIYYKQKIRNDKDSLKNTLVIQDASDVNFGMLI